MSKWKKMYCPQGHLYDEANNYQWQGKRHCRTCRRIKNLKRNFGISIEEYEEMFFKQGGVCCICKSPPGKRPLDIDHNNETGEIRALLCNLCNKTLGGFQHDVKKLQQAINYLNEYS